MNGFYLKLLFFSKVLNHYLIIINSVDHFCVLIGRYTEEGFIKQR